MTRLGMDADAVESAGRALKARAEQIDGIVRSLDRTVKGLSGVWDGKVAKTFVGTWWPEHRKLLVAARAHIDGLGQSALNNASEQRRVSSSAGAGSGSASARGGHIADSTRGVIGEFVGDKRKGELVWIDEVIGADGKHRFVVFVNGTLGDISNVDLKNYFQLHGWAWNFDASANRDTVAKWLVEATMRERMGANSQAEVMIVGYSQGGMLAQQIADDRGFKVTEVMTIGSPPVLADHGYGDANITRLAHGGDEVVNGTAGARNWTWAAAIADASNQVFVRNAVTPLLTGDGSPLNGGGEVHTFRVGDDEPEMVHDVNSGHYDWLADRYDESTDPDIVAARERQAQFLRGEIVRQ